MAREGYFVNAGADIIHDPEAEKKAEETVKTPRGKWDNFWYYHKVHVIVAVIIAIFAIFIIYSAMKTVHPDYYVGMIVQKLYPDKVTDAVGKEIEKYGKDLNGDGKVVVQVNQYYIPMEMTPVSSGTLSGSTLLSSSGSTVNGTAGMANAQMIVAYRTKLAGDFSVGTSMIFLTDDASFRSQETAESISPFAYLNGSTPKTGAADYDRMRVPIAKTKLAGAQIETGTSSGKVLRADNVLKDVSVSLRTYYGTAIEGKQKDYYEASKALFQKIIS
mgnify:CR=1 FL=1